MLLIVSTTTAFSQKPLEFEYVQTFPGFTKDDIYSKVKIWISEYYKSAKNVIELDDKENGVIILHPTSKFNFTQFTIITTYVDYQCKILIKDSKIKIINNSFINNSIAYKAWAQGLVYGEDYKPKFGYGKFYKQLQEHCKNIDTGITESITTTILLQRNDNNW